MVQLYFTYRQSMAFNACVGGLRADGMVTVGVAGRRYRGGRAFVALAVDDHGIIRNAVSLSGFTTLARGRPLPGLFDVKVSQVRGDRTFPDVTPQQREAARQAARLLRDHRAALA